MKTEILNLARRHHACDEAIEWIEVQPESISLADLAAHRPEWALWVATRPGVLTAKELRLFAVFCGRSALGLISAPDPRSVAACDVSEKFANGEATGDDLAAAAAASDAAFFAAAAAAYAAAAAAFFADAAAAFFAASAAAAADAYSAAAAAAAATASDASAQVRWLLANTTPYFGGEK